MHRGPTVMRLTCVYDDRVRSETYASLEVPGTYHLAHRDLPAIIDKHVHGTHALDFGCGMERSTQFLRRQYWQADGNLMSQRDAIYAAYHNDPSCDQANNCVWEQSFGRPGRGGAAITYASFELTRMESR